MWHHPIQSAVYLLPSDTDIWGILSAIFTAAAAGAAWWSTKQMRDTEKDRHMPLVLFKEGAVETWKHDGTVLRLDLKNVGSGLARDIKLFFAGQQLGKRPILPIEAHGERVGAWFKIPVELLGMPPGFEVGTEIFITYKDIYGRSFETRTELISRVNDQDLIVDVNTWKFKHPHDK